jgi:hypothetical protein
MFRFSQRYFQHQRAQAAIDEARQAIEREKGLARRWRRKNPERRPDSLLALWDTTKKDNTKLLSEEMVKTMAFFDSVSEANKTMRFGLAAPDAAIDLETIHDMLFNTFNLRMFEMVADHYKLSQYSRELVIQKLVAQIFREAAPARKSTSFAAEVVARTPDGLTSTFIKPEER